MAHREWDNQNGMLSSNERERAKQLADIQAKAILDQQNRERAIAERREVGAGLAALIRHYLHKDR